VEINSVSALNNANTSFRVYFNQTTRVSGVYSIELGPEILSDEGVVMNQNGGYPNGEADDKYVGTFEIKLPDLTVSDVTAPGTAVLGAEINVSWTTTNAGTADALGSWRDKIYLVKKSDGSGSRLHLATVDAGTGAALGTAIAVGRSVTRSATVTLPLNEEGWGPGEYYLVVESDVDGSVLEISEANNVAVSGKITVDYARFPDLAVSGVTGPTSVAPGDSVTISWTTTNLGELATSGSWNETIYMSFDGTTDDAIALRTLRRSGALAPSGGSENRSATVTIPSSTRVGAFRFLVVADSDGAIPESNENNNAGLSAQATLAGRLFLSVAQADVDEGATQIRATVTRSGAVDQDATVTIAVSDPTEIEAPASVVIPAGQTSAVFYFNALADDEIDGAQTATISVALDGYIGADAEIQIADKDVAAITLTADKTTANEGDAISLTVDLGRPVAQDATVRFYVSRANQLSYPASVVVPAGASTATVVLNVLDDSVPESSEGVTITATSDGFVSGALRLTIDDDDEPTISLSFVSPYIAESAGNNALIGTVSRAEATDSDLRVALSCQDDLGNERFVRLPEEVVIPAGETSVDFFVDAIDGWEVTGDVEITIVAVGIQENCGCSMSTTSTGYATATLTFLDNDCAALALNLGRTIMSAGETAIATISRENATSEKLTVTLRSSDPNALTVPKTVVIPAGKTVSDPFQIVAGENVGSSWATLIASAVGMSSASASILVTDEEKPDLCVSDFELPYSPYAGTTTELSYVVSNQGTAPTDAANGWIEKVWLSKTRTLADDAILLANYSHTGALSNEPGQNSYTRFAEINLPQVVGTYWVVVEIDPEGAVDELLKVNNTVASTSELYIASPYFVNVQTDVDKVAVGGSVPLYGTAYRNDVLDGNGEKTIPAANVDVAVHIIAKSSGIVRTISATTNDRGEWTAVWKPYVNEYGTFDVSATHPALTNGTRQDSFTVMKLVVDDSSQYVNVLDGASKSASFVLSNPTGAPLTDLTCEILDKPENLDVELNVASQIAASGETTATVTVRALNDSIRRSLMTLRFSADSVRPVDVTLEVVVTPLTPSVDYGAALKAGIVPGTQKTLKLDLTNNGGAETGELSLSFPVEWLSCVQGATLESLAPGETRTVEILVSPPEDAPLTIWSGNFAVNYANKATHVPFSIRTVSECIGSLTILAVDEWYFYDETKPTLAGANVSVVDALSGETVASGVTGEDGTFAVATLPEGYYKIRVSAEEHDDYSATIFVEDGENSIRAYLQYQAVTYEWTVTPTSIEDVYDITVTADFVTNVPKPVVIAEPGKVDLRELTEVGDRMQVDIKFTNHGFIAATDFQLSFDGGGHYKMTPLVDVVDVIPAKTSIIVPCIFELIDGDATEEPEVSNATSGQKARGGSGCFDVSFGYVYYWKCGVLQGVSAPIALVYVGGSGCGGHVGGGYVDGGYVGGGYVGGSVSTARVSISSSDCDECVCIPKKKEGSVSIGWVGKWIARKLSSVISKLVPSGSVDVKDVDFTISGSREQCCKPCSSGPGKEPSGEWNWNASVSAGMKGEVFFGLECSLPIEELLGCVSVSNLDELLEVSLQLRLGTAIELGGSLTVEGGEKCDESWEACGEGKLELTVKPLLEGSITVGGMKNGKLYSGIKCSVEGSIATGLKASAKYCWGKGWTLDGCFTGVTVSGSMKGEVKDAASNGFEVKGSFNIPLIDKKCLNDSESTALLESEESDADSEKTISVQQANLEPIFTWEEFFGTELDLTDLYDFSELENWRPTAADVAEGLGYASFDAMKEDLGLSFSATDEMTDEDIDAIFNAKEQKEAEPDPSEGVCATVTMQIEQKAVMTRDAFDAKLVVSNGATKDLEDVDVDIVITDANGNDVTSMFGIMAPTTEGFSGDGDSLGALAAQSQGVANWIIVPSTQLAQNGPEVYYVGGYLNYTRSGVTVSHKMAAAAITVFPQPELELTYFLQRDVIGDDPHTDPIEPSELFELAVMVKNNGAGVAQNLYIESAQPRIVDNEKGLLVDFAIVGSKVDGEDAAPTLTVNFGDVDPGEITVGEWFMTSTLQGQFENCDVTFRHRNDFGDIQFSIIKKVEILQLIRPVDALNGDAKTDFLVNAVKDVQDTPDTLYLSDGSVESVSLATDSEFVGERGDDWSLTVSTTLQKGWNYARLTDERLRLDNYRLVRVVRDDGVEISLDNAWTTDRTFVEAGRRPVMEDSFHLLDYNASVDATEHTYTLYFDSSDQTPPTIVALQNPAEGVDYRVEPLDAVEVEFDEPIALATMTAENVEITRNGENVELAGISFEHVADSRYRIVNLPAAASEDGEYVLTINTLGIKDVHGNAGVDKSFAVSWITAASAPIVVSMATTPAPADSGAVASAVESVEIVFSQPLKSGTFTTDDLVLTRGTDGDNLIDPQKVTIVKVSGAKYRVKGLSTLTAEEGRYFFTVKSSGVASASSVDGFGEKTHVWLKDTIGPVSAIWDGDAAGHMNVPAYSVDVVFNEEVVFDSFRLDDVTFTCNGAPLTLDSNFVMGVIETTDYGQRWRIRGFEHFLTADGVYEITLNLAGLQDVYGNYGVGTSSYSWVYDTQAPTMTFDSTTIWTNSETVAIAGLVSEENVSIAIYDAWTNKLLKTTKTDGRAFETSVPLSGDSVRELKVQATDLAGNVGEATITVVVDKTAPTVENVETLSVMAGDERNELRVSFSEAVNLESLVQTGAIVDVVTLANTIGDGVFALRASDFRYDAAAQTLVISLDDLDPAILKESAISVQDSVANALVALSIDSTQIRDRAGNMLRGTDLAATSGAPDRLGAHALVAQLDAYSAPALADWNADGVLDLIVGEKSDDGKGRVKVFLNQGTDAAPVYADGFYAGYRNESGVNVEIAVSAGGCQGAAPRLADITGDGVDDLIVGLSNGTIQLYRGVSTSTRVFAAPELFVVGVGDAKSTLDVGNRAVFDVYDWNADGRNDLVVGAMDGKLRVYLDSATTAGEYDYRAAMTLTDGAAEIAVDSGRSAPAIADVNGDGAFDIVTGATSGDVYVYLNLGSNAAPKFQTATPIVNAAGVAINVGDMARSRLAVRDVTGDGIADYFIGAADGSVEFYEGVRLVAPNSDGEPGDEFYCTTTFAFDASLLKNAIEFVYDAATRQATLSWDPIANATSYRVRLSKDAGATWSNYKTLDDVQTTTVNSLYAGRTYMFEIVGYSANGDALATTRNATFAPIAVVSAAANFTQSAPITITITGAAESSCDVRWYAITDDGDVEIVEAAGQTTYTLTKAFHDVKIVVTGTNYSKGCVSEIVLERSAVTLQKFNSGSRQALVEWPAIDGAASYLVRLSKDGGATWSTYAKNVLRNGCAVNGVYPGRSYTLRVYGITSEGAQLRDFVEGTIAPIALVQPTTPYR
ncbi:MAG: VCBS repeat-containing protein, partial [Thermoguttaceae bacterium]|nr:VCBS repeat-containing protein [Thermoguttaceae bacterium]